MKRIVMISTGGTIACVPSESGLKPGLSAKELLNLIEGDFDDIECVDLFSMDSSNIQPEEWITIAEAVKANVSSCDGIVITHGTDTMA
ncbi:MAG: asparaginase, partial [Clostridia bacterium]|nr:asparaginase [Clostridia bacterium]